jgi:EmrB/QacA subfamily drug resistance transporter
VAQTTSTASDRPTSEYGIPRRRLIVIFIGLILGILMAALDQTIVATALPTIAGELHGLSEISWIITVYLLAQTIAMPVYGKVGDFMGRRNAFHLAIGIFLLGSVLAGIAQSMGMLIVFRAVQGLGAGGLMIGAQTIIAEIVTARERGKYMSVMGPMIGVATVLGPLLGGFLTEHVSWRWIFYINVPIGAAAFIVTTIVLKLPARQHPPKQVDYAGVLTLAAAIASLVLLLNWGGRRYDWISLPILLLAIGVVVFAPLWMWIERRAVEPVLPLRLFKNEVFRVIVPMAFMVGVALFGAVSYLPTYLQLSLDASATKSGILMLPLMGGLMLAAVITGQTVSRTGRYKAFPIVGGGIAAIGLYLLSFMNATTSRGDSSLYMIVLGLGIGCIMPILVLVVQNSVRRQDMGTATAGVNLFRQLGASFGTALIGSLFVNRLTTNLQDKLPPHAAAQAGKISAGITPAQLHKLPSQIAHAIVVSYADALTPLYAYLAPLLAATMVVAFFLKEIPLSTTLGGAGGRRDDQNGSDSPQPADQTSNEKSSDGATTGRDHSDGDATPRHSQSGGGHTPADSASESQNTIPRHALEEDAGSTGH